MLLKKVMVFTMSAMLVLLLCGMAGADEYHYVNHLVGDRASGMGGAYTAVSDDVSGLYYNPAGIMYSTGRNLSASVNAYFYQTKKYDSVIGGNGWERKSSSLLPNYFGIIQPAGKFKFGFSYAVPDSTNEDQDQIFYNVPSNDPTITVKKYVINFNNEDNTYQFGPSLAAELNKDMAVGVTLYFHQRRNQFILNQFLSKNTLPLSYEWLNTYHEMNEWGFRPILGFIWSPQEKLSLGLALSKIMVHRSSTTNYLTAWDSGAAIVKEPMSDPKDNFDPGAKRKYPLQMSAGAAYFASTSLLLTADATYYTKVTDANFGDRVSVVNGALGAEYYYSKSVAIRGGIYTDQSNSPQVQAGRSGQAEHIDLTGASLSISTFTRNTSITLGGSMASGSGDAQILGGNSTSIQNVSSDGWTLFLSSTYSY